MKTIKTIIAGGLILQYHKTKKDYLVCLVGKSYKSFNNLGSKKVKIGVKFARQVPNTNNVEFWERTKIDKRGQKYTLIGTYTFTEVKTTATNVVVKKQKYYHKDIIQSKDILDIIFEDGSMLTTSGKTLNDHLFNGMELPEAKHIEIEQTEEAPF